MDRRTFIGHGAQAALAFGILPHAEALERLALRGGQPSRFAQLRDRYFSAPPPPRRPTWGSTRTAPS